MAHRAPDKTASPAGGCWVTAGPPGCWAPAVPAGPAGAQRAPAIPAGPEGPPGLAGCCPVTAGSVVSADPASLARRVAPGGVAAPAGRGVGPAGPAAFWPGSSAQPVGTAVPAGTASAAPVVPAGPAATAV